MIIIYIYIIYLYYSYVYIYHTNIQERARSDVHMDCCMVSCGMCGGCGWTARKIELAAVVCVYRLHEKRVKMAHRKQLFVLTLVSS